MTALAVSRTSSSPSSCSAAFDFYGVLFLMAPLAQAFKIIQSVIHVVPVFVVNLAHAGFTASFTWLLWLQARRCACGPVAGSGAAGWVGSMGHALASPPAVDSCLELVALSASHGCIRRIHPLRAKLIQANWAYFAKAYGHLPAIILALCARVGMNILNNG